MVVTVLVVLLLAGLVLVAYFVGWIMAAQGLVFCIVSAALSPLLTALYVLSQKQNSNNDDDQPKRRRKKPVDDPCNIRLGNPSTTVH